MWDKEAPFWDLPSLVWFLVHNAKNNGDNLILWDGGEGAGKSTGAITLTALLIALMRQLWPESAAAQIGFDPASQCIYDHGDWMEIYNQAALHGERGHIFLIDEGGNLLGSRDSMTGESRGMVRMLQQSRILNATVLCLIPNQVWIDKYVREHRAIIRIHTKRQFTINGQKRGEAIVQWRGENWRSGESQWVDVFEWHYGRIIEGPGWHEYERVKELKISNSARQEMAKKAKADAKAS